MKNTRNKIVYKWPKTGRLEIKITGIRSAVIKYKPKALNRELTRAAQKAMMETDNSIHSSKLKSPAVDTRASQSNLENLT